MTKVRPLTKGERILLSIFLLIVLSIFIVLASGVPYITIESVQMSFWLMIIVPIEIILSGIIFTYSFAQYTLDGQFRNLVLVLIAVNMMLDAFLYILTNTAFAGLSPFADRDRNRTIVIAFSIILGPTVLFGSLTNKGQAPPRQKIAALFWGLVIVPAIAFWFFFNPDPVFVTTPTGQGLSGFTPIAWISLIGVPIALIMAMSRYIKAWRRERQLVDLSTVLAQTLWLLAIGIFASQTNPLQVIELVWYSTFTFGMLLIAIVTISSSVIEPQKNLTKLVENRTIQLEKAMEESEFYLNLWGHKIGNLLQAMILYLEMFSSKDMTRDEIMDLSDVALDIGRETNLINRQVAVLIRLKEERSRETYPVEIDEILQKSLSNIFEILGSRCSIKLLDIPKSTVQILADEFLDLVITNIITYLYQHTDTPTFTIQYSELNDQAKIEIRSKGEPTPEDVNAYFLSSFEQAQTTLNLHLFTVRLLMTKYGGEVEYTRIEPSSENVFTLTLQKAPVIDIGEIPYRGKKKE